MQESMKTEDECNLGYQENDCYMLHVNVVKHDTLNQLYSNPI